MLIGQESATLILRWRQFPRRKSSGLEFRSTKYEVETEPFFDGIFSWITRQSTTRETRHLITAYVPITADGSTNKIYTGTKDYFVLSEYNKILTSAVGRPIDIEDFVNFSNWTYIRPITKPHCGSDSLRAQFFK